jgi:hypothetical protein
MKLKSFAATIVVAGVGVATGALIIAGVLGATASPDQQNRVDDVAFAHAVEVLAARYEHMDAIWVDERLRETLPNVEFSIEGEAPSGAYGSIVEGPVTEVAPGAGFFDVVSENGAESVETEFGSPDATWRSIVITVAVRNDYDPAVETPETVRIGLVIPADADPETMMNAFVGRHVIAVLDKEGTFAPLEPARSVGRSGGLFGFVDADGTISMPFLGASESEYLGDLTTLEAVAAASDDPSTIIDVAATQGSDEWSNTSL